MSPKNTLNSPTNTLNLKANKATDDGGHRLRRCRQPPLKSDKKKKKKDKKKKKKKRRSKKLKLNESEANKTLYICFDEEHDARDGDRITYVVRSIKLSNLLSSDSVDNLQLRQVAYKTGDELPGFIGCGVVGSQIVFAGGKRPPLWSDPNHTWQRDVYVFETDPDKQPPGDSSSVIQKMDAQLLQAKYFPVMIEVGGKLYALSYERVSDPAFEVFDPEMGTWSALPQPPFFRRDGPYQRGCLLSYAITGTKMFVSQGRFPVYCFDVAHPDREWRLVRSMCERGPFPFTNRALVLDLPVDHNNNRKIMFGYTYDRWYLGVYIMCLDENQESITRIADLKLPVLPEEFEFAKRWYILHIGGQKACLVFPEMTLPGELAPEYEDEIGSHKTRGVVIPFQFEVDITKIDKDTKNCLTLQFMPTRIFEFYTSPSTYACPRTDGCFVL